MSTAFEDFELNTATNTLLLLEEGKPVDETAKMLSNYGFDHYPEAIDLPVVMDASVPKEGLELEQLVNTICTINSHFADWPDTEKAVLQGKIREYLNSHDQLSYTFMVNQFRGTPTFVVYNNDMEILHQWFGHMEHQTISESLKNLMPQP